LVTDVLDRGGIARVSTKPKVYLASPLGFAASTHGFMADLVGALGQSIDVNNPWDDHRFDRDFADIAQVLEHEERVRRLHAINHQLGRGNEERIRASDALIAVLDGVDVDSGTASEIGFAYALGMRVYGIRTDFRLAGDNLGSVVNLQVQYFIEQSGGRIVGSIDEISNCASELASAKTAAS
jgi:nucleoside 2-deoxyribosyltransferase